MTIAATNPLGLGTVQFGQNYGITNQVGRVPEDEVRNILTLAHASGLRVLDTAPSYGKSEAVLGKLLQGSAEWRIVTKTPKFQDLKTPNMVRRRLAESVASSLAALSVSSLYGLLVHDADDLTGNNGSVLWDALAELRAQGVVQKIGASVYGSGQVERLLGMFDLDLIQLPLSAVDQRMVKCGLVTELARVGIEIHARSVFLQGLLLADPKSIDPAFGSLSNAVSALHAAWRKEGLTPLEGALGAVLLQPEIDRVILGITSTAELRQITAAQHKISLFPGRSAIELQAIDDENIVNPARWGRFPVRN